MKFVSDLVIFSLSKVFQQRGALNLISKTFPSFLRWGTLFYFYMMKVKEKKTIFLSTRRSI
jgi:hypothetical protein